MIWWCFFYVGHLLYNEYMEDTGIYLSLCPQLFCFMKILNCLNCLISGVCVVGGGLYEVHIFSTIDKFKRWGCFSYAGHIIHVYYIHLYIEYIGGTLYIYHYIHNYFALWKTWIIYIRLGGGMLLLHLGTGRLLILN